MTTHRGYHGEIAKLKIGDTLYHFDGNRRVYRKEGGGGPIYREHFKPEQIVGETKVSWLVGNQQTKVSKRTLDSGSQYSFSARGYFTKEAMEEDIWVNEHRHKIVQAVQQAGVHQLQEIARVVGYTPPDSIRE